MPLLDGTQVSPLPLPSQINSLSPDTEVWSINQTGEIFLDYESYANRYIFYSQPIFKPNHQSQPSSSSSPPSSSSSQDQSLTFFDALQSEDKFLDSLIQTEFSDSLKSRLLASIITSDAREHSIDNLTNHLYRLHHNRFHKDEKVMVDLSFNQPPSPSSTVYYARILKVFPPKPLRDLAKSKGTSSDLIHLQALDQLQLNLKETLAIDDPKSYLYTIQLIEDHQSKNDDQEDGFGGSFMEVEPKKLSRHPNSFSKALLKRFIQSSLLPVSSLHTDQRWRVPDELLQKYGVINSQPPLLIPILPPHPPRTRLKRGPRPIPTTRTVDQTEVADIDTKRTIKKRKRNKISTTPLMLHHPPSYETYLHPQCSINPSSNHEPTVLHSINLMEWSSNPSLKIISQPSPPLATPDHKKKTKWRMSSNHHLLHHQEEQMIPKPIQKEVSRKLVQLEQPLQSNVDLSPLRSAGIENVDQVNKSNAVKKTIKYPIEDLDLDPLTMIDGRYLRRSSGLIPSLPTKPIPSIPKDPQTFEKSLMIWSFLNIFEFIDCGMEELNERLDEIIKRLVEEIQIDLSLRYPTTRIQNEGIDKRLKSRSILPFFSKEPLEETKVMSIEEREYWIRKSIKFSNLWRSSITSSTTPIISSQSNFNSENKARKKKRKSNLKELKEDWVMGLVEILCQRGGIEVVGCMGRLMKYLFSKDGILTKITYEPDFKSIQDDHHEFKLDQIHPKEINNTLSNAGTEGIELGEEEIDELGIEEEEEEEEESKYGKSLMNRRSDHQFMMNVLKTRFGECDSRDKLSLIKFLCDLVIEGDYVRNYIEDCDEKLTVVRKEKADVNKEKRKT
ncbi:ATP-utilizing chromatin assembly and remodelling N-terminal-domain-containing protein [Melampsora americana]|nr:ATP-utilizing chromatin assembly and remodelling N-terminal-domain-containing protein [Melampsora americana]